MKPAIRKVLSRIAAKRLNIPTLETRGSDSLDFHELSVWSIHDALNRAFSAGKLAAQTADITPYTRCIRKIVDRADDLIRAIEGATDQFEPEARRLQQAITEAAKLLKGGVQ